MPDRTQAHPEPGPPDHRQGREMLHVPDLANHATHDLELIAAHAAGDASGPELETAATMVAGCSECARLHRDLISISVALADLPAPARSRDFRLTADQAAALRPAGWRAWLSTLAGPRFSFAAPLGTALATLGLVGLLIAGPGFSLSLGGPTAMAPNEAPAAAPDGAGPESLAGAGSGVGSAAPSAAASAEPGAGAASMAPVAPQAAESPPPVPQASGSTAYSAASPKATTDLQAGGEASEAPSADSDMNVAPTPAASAAVAGPVSGGDDAGGSTDRTPTDGSGTTSRASDQAGSGGLLASTSSPVSPVAIGAAVVLLLGLLLVGARLAARRLA